MTIVFDLLNAPRGLFDTNNPEAPTAHARKEWEALNLWEVVRGIGGNATLLQLDSGRTRLQIWDPRGEYLPLKDDGLTFRPVDDELTIGWDERPTPSLLDNGNPLGLSCQPLELADGQVWEIPEIREPVGTKLPRDLVRDRKTGSLTMPLKVEYQNLWEEGEFWFDLFWKHLEGSAKTFDLDRGLAFATQVMALRYRFCDAVQTALRVIDSTNLEKLIFIAIGFDQVLEILNQRAQKKSD